MRRATGDAAVDAIVVGSGPNGLAAAITLARAGRSVRVYEAADRPGGGTRTAELTLPGFRHDVCATILPLIASPFFGSIDLPARGVDLIHSDAPLAHPLDDGRAVVLERSVATTAAGLGPLDGRAWRRLFGPLARDAARLAPELLGPVVHRPAIRWRSPGSACRRSARRTAWPAAGSTTTRPGRCSPARPPIRCSARSPADASFGLVLATAAHAGGWPMVRGGVGALAGALVAELEAPGGEIVTGRRIGTLAELPPPAPSSSTSRRASSSRSAAIGCRPRTRRRAEAFRYGPGVFKVDWALDGPVPWTADGPRRAATVHLGGTTRRDRRGRGRGRGRPTSRPPVRAVRPVRAVGPDPRPRRQDDSLGVLPRARRARTST